VIDHHHRAQTTGQAQERRDYLDVIFAAIPVEPFTREMAQLAARIDAETRKIGPLAARFRLRNY